MEYNISKINSTTAEVNFKTTKEDLEKYIEKAYVNLSKKVHIPGFRPGKAPLNVVKKNVGLKDVLNEAINLLIMETYNSVVDKLEPKPITLPHFELENFDQDKGVEFKAYYEFFPEIKIPKYNKFKLKKEELIEDFSFIDDVLKEFARINYELIPKEDNEENFVEEDDVVLVDFKILKKDKDKIIYDFPELEFDLKKNIPVPNLKENLMKKKVNDEFEYIVKFPNFVGFPKVSNKEVKIKFKVLGIKKRVEPEVNDEFAKNLKYENLEDLKNAFKKNLVNEAEKYLNKKAYEELIKEIIQESEIEIPETNIRNIIKDDINYIARKNNLPLDLSIEDLAKILNKKPEEIEKELREIATFRAKKYIIIKELAKRENITVQKEEIDQKIKNVYLGFVYSDDDIKFFLENKDIREEIELELLEEKVKEFIMKNSEIQKKGKVSLKELYEKNLFDIKLTLKD